MRDAIARLITRIFSLDEKEWRAAKVTFKISDVLFKLASWITLVGLFKYVAEQTNSAAAQLIYWVLNTILFCVLVFAASSIDINVFKNAKTWQKYLNAIASFMFSLVAWLLINHALSSIVTDMIAIR